MTIDEVIQIVEVETGQKVTAETRLADLNMDSLEFLSLLVAVGNIPDEMVSQLNTVYDLYRARQ